MPRKECQALRELLIEAANELDVSEYDIFVQAWSVYFTSPPDHKVIGTQYGCWMNDQIAMPFYVQYFLTSLMWA